MSAVLKKALRRNSPHNKDIAILEKLLYFLYLSKPLRMILLFHKTSSEVQFFVLFVIQPYTFQYKWFHWHCFGGYLVIAVIHMVAHTTLAHSSES